MKPLSKEEIAAAVAEGLAALAANPGKAKAIVYPQGFLPNAYHYPAPGERVAVWRDGRHSVQYYDRKRSHGEGPRVSLWTENARW